jgi:fido (protein-threonine AMPylation protein)
MHPPNCPGFEYKEFRHHHEILLERTADVLKGLWRGTLSTRQLALDSRPVHLHLFQDLTPGDCSYYAGHYRGEEFRCLRHYPVTVPGDPRVGHAPHLVLKAMASAADAMRDAIEALDTQHADPFVSTGDKLVSVVKVACSALELVLRIHPYANGNGHAARFIVWAILGRYGYWPRRWPIEPRPADPPYTELIVQYRNGNHGPLEAFLLTSLLQQ